MDAAWRPPNMVVRNATRVPSGEGAGDQAAATDSRCRRRVGRSSAGTASISTSASIEFRPPLDVLSSGVSERDRRGSQMVHSRRAGSVPGKDVQNAPTGVGSVSGGWMHPRRAPPGRSGDPRHCQQESWAQQAISTRPSRAELDAVRSGDFNAVGRARTAFRRLLQAIDRGTWIRNTSSQLMVDDPVPRLAASFDRAGQLRFEAIQAADELSSALAQAKGGLSIGDLQPGFEAIRKAQASEDRIARLPPRPGGLRLAPAPLPVPRPFIASAARLVSANPELTRELDRLPPSDAAQIRARLADIDRGKEEQQRSGRAAAAAAPLAAAADTGMDDVPAPADPKEAEAPSPTLTIANDAAALLAKRMPRSITLREDGLFG